MSPERTLLHGWGRTNPSAGRVIRLQAPEEIALFLKEATLSRLQPGTVKGFCVARGLGRSYGDAAQCAGGTVFDSSGLAGIGAIDVVSGSVRVGAGVSLGQVLERYLPDGWFLPVTPGTRHVSIGGAIAADVHGKNHHADGAFGHYVESFVLASPSGVTEVSERTDPDLFWATIGGMGLTGVITEATIRLIPIETSSVTVKTTRCRDLATVMSIMEETDPEFQYSVAWIDTMARGRSLGRSVLTQGNHTPLDELPAGQRLHPIQRLAKPRLTVPGVAPRGLLNRASIRLFNEAWYRAAPSQPHTTFEQISSYFYPLDALNRWNLLYGRLGFVQYQFCVPPERGDVVAGALDLLASRRVPTFLSVLKRFGPADSGFLSFPRSGWTLALDLPLGPPELESTLREIDDRVATCGGRVYLAKDARLDPDHFAAMYPRRDELAAVRRRVDPAGALASDLSRRLGLTPAESR